MRIFTTILTALALMIAGAETAPAQNLPPALQKYTKANKKKSKDGATSAHALKVRLKDKGVTRIEIYRDTESSTTRQPHTVTFDNRRITYHIGEPGEDVDGLVDTYYNNDKQALSNAIEHIDRAGLRMVTAKAGENVSGVTRLKIYKNDKFWISLQVSPQATNVAGSFMSVVNDLEDMMGYVPEIKPLVPEPGPDIDNDPGIEDYY